MPSIAENVRLIQENIAAVCTKAGRKPEEVTLLAVTKIFPAEKIVEVTQAGVFDIGENFVQEVREKYEKITDKRIRWHFIGHLQKNKVKYIAPWVYFIHSVDSIELCEEINKRAAQSNRVVDILLEVNTSGEESKHGVKPEQLVSLVEQIQHQVNISFKGLMTMGPLSDDVEDARPCFRLLRELRNEIERKGINTPHLSMGMSGDYEIAIEEGATILRLGTAIFGKRIYNDK